MANVNPEKQYDALGWRNLPCDVTRNAFLGNMRRKGNPLSVSTLSKTLSYLEQDRHADNPSIYQDLCQPRDTKTDDKTLPRLIPWEVYTLLEAIVQARPHHEKVYGDDLAQRVLEELFKSLDNPTSDTEAEDYRLWHILNNDGIQQVALFSFTGALKSRLSYIENEVCAPSHKINAEKLLLALEQLDVLIYLLQQKPSNVPKKYDSVTSAVLGLYTDLLSVRNSLNIDAVVEKRDKTAFNWYRTDRTNSLVDAMICQLKKTSRNPTPEQVSSFLSLYLAYLSEVTDTQTKESAESFANMFKHLKTYVNATETAADVEQRIRHDLCAFANNVFADLDRLDTIGYAYSLFEPTTAGTAYLRSPLSDCHCEILRIIHEPLRLLRAVYSYFFFTKDGFFLSYNGYQEIQAITKQLIAQQKHLANLYPKHLSFILSDDTTIYDFANQYYTLVSPIIDQHVPYEIIDTIFTSMQSNDLQKKFFAAAELLKLQCKMVVAIEVTEAIPHLTKNYIQMQKLFSL